MTRKTLLTTFVFAAIQQMPSGSKVELHELYRSIKGFLLTGELPDAPKHIIDVCRALRECSERGDLENEPRYKNDIRWAIRYAKDARLLRHVGTPKSGEWLRT